MSGVMEDMDGIAPSDIAERWYARLMAPDCSLRDREKFETWLSQSPENALAFEDTKALWASLGGLDQDEVIAPHVTSAFERDANPFMAQWASAAEGISRRTPSAHQRAWLPAGAGIAAALAIALFLLPVLKPNVPTVAYEASTKVQSIALSDGSSAQLDLETAIDVRISDSRRDIELRQGRVVFDVAKDPQRPFIVDAGVGTVTALGTQFQVQRNGDLVSVTLLEGSVGIDAAARGGHTRSLRLVPGQEAKYSPETRSWTVETVDPAALISWSRGFHVFAATSLQQAFVEINRYSEVKLVLADPSVGELLVSGSFKLGDGKAISEALPYAIPVKVSERDGTMVISRR